MVLAMRHGVLGYEAMDLNHLLINFPFGVFNYVATRRDPTPRSESFRVAEGAPPLFPDDPGMKSKSAGKSRSSHDGCRGA